MIPTDLSTPLVLAGIGAFGAWVWSVEGRIVRHEAILTKLDELIDLLLEERLGQPNRPPSRSDR